MTRSGAIMGRIPSRINTLTGTTVVFPVLPKNGIIKGIPCKLNYGMLNRTLSVRDVDPMITEQLTQISVSVTCLNPVPRCSLLILIRYQFSGGRKRTS